MYIANLMCKNADDVDGRHWLVGADGDEYISCDDEQAAIFLLLFSYGRFISSSSSASSFHRSIHVVYVRLI